MKRILLRPNENAYRPVCMFMQTQLGFELIETGREKSKSIKSHAEHLIDGLYSIFSVTRKIQKIREAEIVFCIGDYSTLYLMVLNKLNLIHPGFILWWGFFIHSKKIQKILKIIFKIVDCDNVRFIVFSECERAMYKQSLGISDRALVSIPYGNWNNTSTVQEVDSSGNYFFGGGYSNRDYKSLLSSWVKYLPEERLIIIGSRNNKDLVEFYNHYEGDKIKVLFDTTTEVFNEYLKRSIACILPFKENTGASGQSVMLRCMKYNKLVISYDTDVIREYTDGNSMFLIRNYESDLINAIRTVKEGGPKLIEMLQRQELLYTTKFSFENISKRLREIIEDM